MGNINYNIFKDVNRFSHFYRKKSIANSQQFSVTMSFDSKGVPRSQLMSKYYNLIQPHHVVGVDIPLNKFERVSTNTGMMEYSFPVLTAQQGMDIKITFEEDNRGTIAGFIQALQLMVFRNGANVSPYNSILGDIYIVLYDTQLEPISQYIYKDVFFLGGTTSSLSYSNSQAVMYDITFGTSYMQFEEVTPNPQLYSPMEPPRAVDPYVSHTVVPGSTSGPYLPLKAYTGGV